MHSFERWSFFYYIFSMLCYIQLSFVDFPFCWFFFNVIGCYLGFGRNLSLWWKKINWIGQNLFFGLKLWWDTFVRHSLLRFSSNFIRMLVLGVAWKLFFLVRVRQHCLLPLFVWLFCSTWNTRSHNTQDTQLPWFSSDSEQETLQSYILLRIPIAKIKREN